LSWSRNRSIEYTSRPRTRSGTSPRPAMSRKIPQGGRRRHCRAASQELASFSGCRLVVPSLWPGWPVGNSRILKLSAMEHFDDIASVRSGLRRT
jgi:hypothetical protein